MSIAIRNTFLVHFIAVSRPFKAYTYCDNLDRSVTTYLSEWHFSKNIKVYRSVGFASFKMTIKVQLAREFKVRNLQWQHTYVDDFAITQWQDFTTEADKWFLAYRIGHFIVYIIIIIVFCSSRCHELSTITTKHMVYLSSWVHILATFSSMFGIICILYEDWVWKCSKWIGFTVAIFPWSHRFYWILHSTSLDMVFAVCLYYGIYRSTATEYATLFNDVYHVWIFILSLVDLYLVSIPLKLLHVYSSMVFFIVYITFNGCYTTSGYTDPYGHPYIYKILDWNRNSPRAWWMTILAIMLLVLVRFVVWILMKTRKYAYKIYCKERKAVGTSSSSTNVFSSSF